MTSLVALTLAVRLPNALGEPLWYDEVYSARIVEENTFSGVVSHVRRTESMPPGWYSLAWLGRETGLSVEALRVFSALFSAALVGMVVAWGRRLMPLWGAGLAGLLLALGWQFFFHGSELRAYALLALLSFAFAPVLARATEKPSLGRLVSLGLLVAIGALTHYFFLLSVLAGAIWLWTGTRSRRTRLATSATLGVALVPFAVWLPFFVTQYERNREFTWIGSFDPLKFLYLYSSLFEHPGGLYASSAHASLDPGEAVRRLVPLILVLAGAYVLARRSDQGRLCALLAVVPVVVAGIAWLAGGRVFNSRNLIGVGPFAALAIAGALTALPRRFAIPATAAAAILIAVGFADVAQRPTRPAYDRIAAAFVAAGWDHGDPIIRLGRRGLGLPLAWHLPDRPFLQRAVPKDDSCETAYVVGPRRSVEPFLQETQEVVPETLVIKSIVVARVPWSKALALEALDRGGGILASSKGPPPCTLL